MATAETGIVLLAAPSRSTRILYHTIARFGIERVILERPVSKTQFARRRIRRLGVARVAGQSLFRGLVVPILKATAGRRIEEILESNRLHDGPIPEDAIVRVPSVNHERTKEVLRTSSPRLVLVNGTRIIVQDVLDAVSARFVNIHAGITPGYRGVHGGYWALAQNEPEACGVTVHFVDSGIDTGGIIAQARIDPTPRDSFVTYPFLQLAKGITLLEAALPRLMRGDVETLPSPPLPSRLWTHPTLGEYVKNRLRHGVR